MVLEVDPTQLDVYNPNMQSDFSENREKSEKQGKTELHKFRNNIFDLLILLIGL